MTFVLSFIFVLCAAVVLHEFGHFVVAKLLGVRVETFSVGFGWRLFGYKWGTTDYRVSAIPLGGYVKLGGDESNAPIEGEGATDIPPGERFDLRPRWQRFLIAIAGPVMNILTALSIPFIGGLMYGVPTMPAPAVSYVFADGAAAKAGLQPGDRIVSFNGVDNPEWDTIRGDAALSPDQQLPMVIERRGQRLALNIKPSPFTEHGETAGELDFVPDNGGFPVVIRGVAKDSPASEAGLQAGDRIVGINHEQVKSAEQVTYFIREHKPQPLNLTVDRNGAQREVTVTARPLPPNGAVLIGITPGDDYPLHKWSPIASAGYAVKSNVGILRLTAKALGQFAQGKRSARNTISGPIGIYQAVSTSVERFGWGGLFYILGFLSLNLGVFNLLPIPVLDGGAMFLLIVEGFLALLGLAISATVRERIQQAGFVVVILLMVFVITNDVLKLFPRNSESNKPAATAPAK